LKGLCHDCHSSGIETKLDEFSKPLCLSCREELAAIKRKESNMPLTPELQSKLDAKKKLFSEDNNA